MSIRSGVRRLSVSARALKALDFVDELEQQLSVYREDSEVSRLNRTAGQGPVRVAENLWKLIQVGLTLHQETQGAFDLTAGPLSKVWGFYRRSGGIPDEVSLQTAMQKVGSAAVKLDEQGQTVEFQKPGLELNFGGIGKGYALDEAGRIMFTHGVDDFLLHGGASSVLACSSAGMQAATAWPVGVGHPLKPGQQLVEIQLMNRGLSTSGSGTQFFRHAGRRYGHILDPRTGQPADGLLSVTVTAPSAALADALSTAFYVLGVEKSMDYCAKHPEIAALFVLPSTGGRVQTQAAGFAEGELVWETEPAD